ncbi:MAG: FIG01085635: hypothetical protein, partial [uncultured Gemmatimonadetes bacterium]
GPQTHRHRAAPHPRLPRRSVHRGNLRHGRGLQARLRIRAPRLVQPGPGDARNRPPSRRAATHPGSTDQHGGPGVRARGRHPRAAHRRRRPVQPPVPPGQGVAVHRRQRLHLRRRPAGAHPHGRGAGRDQPGALSSRLHRVRGAAEHLPHVHGDPHPAGRHRRLPVRHGPAGARDHGPRTVCPAPFQPVEPHGAHHPWAGAGVVGRSGPAAGVHAAAGRVLLALRLVRHARRGRPGLGRSLRGRRGRRPGGHHGRAHQELALPRLADHVGRGPQGGDRGGDQRGLVPGRRRQPAPAARRRRAAGARGGARRDGRHPRRVPAQAAHSSRRAARRRHAAGRGARGHLLHLGRPGGPSRAAERRHGLLPGGAGGKGDLRAGRVLRHQPGQAPQRADIAVPHLRALLVRPRRGGRGRRGAAPGRDGAALSL